MVENAAPVQGPKSHMPDENRDDRAYSYGCVPGEYCDPSDVELLPRGQCVPRPSKIGCATANRHNLLIETVAACHIPIGRYNSGRSCDSRKKRSITDGDGRAAMNMKVSGGDCGAKQRVTYQFVYGDHEPANRWNAKCDGRRR